MCCKAPCVPDLRVNTKHESAKKPKHGKGETKFSEHISKFEKQVWCLTDHLKIVSHYKLCT